MNPVVKKYSVIGASGLAVLVATFAVGRFTTPVKVVEKEKLVDKTIVVEKVDETKLQALVEELKFFKSQLTDIKKSIHREEHTIKHPDGLVETTKVEDVNVSTVVKEQDIRYVDREVKVTETKYVDRVVTDTKTVEKEKIVTAERPQWKLTPMVGVNVRDLSLAQGLTTGPFVFGATVEHRFIGPFSLGAWGLSSGTAGLAVTVEF